METPFARPAAADLWNVSDDERQFGDRGPQLPVPSTKCFAASGLVTEVPTGLGMLSRISAEPEGQIPLAHTGTLPPRTPKFKGRFRASATVVNLTAGWAAAFRAASRAALAVATTKDNEAILRQWRLYRVC